jgi:hypothetical protein
MGRRHTELASGPVQRRQQRSTSREKALCTGFERRDNDVMTKVQIGETVKGFYRLIK